MLKRQCHQLLPAYLLSVPLFQPGYGRRAHNNLPTYSPGLSYSSKSRLPSKLAPKAKPLGLSKPNSDLGLATKLIGLHQELKELGVKPVVTPVHQSSTYRRVPGLGYESESGEPGYVYSRCGNANTDEACMLINSVEGGSGTILYPSGMAALTNTLMCFLSPGDHVITGAPLYSGLQEVFERYFPQYNIEVDYVSCAGNPVDVIEGETICNPLLWVLDVPKFAELGKEKGIMTVIDGTFTTPINMNVLEMGVDVVCQSGTKYIGGHSDLLSGTVTLADPATYERLEHWSMLMGPSVSPTEAVMVVRSLRTLDLRMNRVNENGLKVAQFLQGHPAVKKVIYAGLESHPHHSLAKQLMKGFGGMITLDLESQDAAIRMIESTRLVMAASSLGGVESLILHIATMLDYSPEALEQFSITESMVRISVGIENVEDIIDDLNLALADASTADK